MFSKINSYIDNNEKKICFRILLYSFILKLFYSILMQYDISTHDLWDPSDWSNVTTGGLGYIQYIYQHLSLPLSMEGQFYHPPLYYAFSAIIMAITYGPTKDLTFAFDQIQNVTMIMAFLITFVCYKLFIEIGIRGHKLVYATLFICTCPVLYNMGACINNDCLMTLFCVLVVLYAVKWSKSYGWKDIILTALLLALGMLSKTSAVLLAPALGIPFIYKLFINRKSVERIRKLICQYLVFALVSISLGMSFLIRNWILFKMPFNYIMRLYIDPFDVPLITRIGLPSINQMTTAFTDFDDIEHYSNIWGQIVQSFLFDERIFNIDIPLMNAIAIMLIWITYVILIFMLIQFVRLIASKRLTVENRIIFCVSYITLMASFIVFCFEYRFICTMHTRYIFLTIVMLAVGFGLAPDFKNKKAGEIIDNITSVLLVLFSIVSVVLYLIPVRLHL